MTRILCREGVDPQVSVFFFKAVVQAVLLFGVETWVVAPSLLRILVILFYASLALDKILTTSG